MSTVTFAVVPCRSAVTLEISTTTSWVVLTPVTCVIGKAEPT
jgi:hypothetical protein